MGMVDIDFFKKINDTYGHEAGHIVLQHVPAALEGAFRSTDIVARFGGEEFCILVSDADPRSVFKIFGTIRRTIEDLKINVDGKELSVTVSIGYETDHAMEFEEMIDSADEYLYEAKQRGRNRVVSLNTLEPDG